MKRIRVDWSRGNCVRQGDVLVMNNNPKVTAKHKGSPRVDGGVVLAFGEKTGHRHQFRNPNVCMLVAEGVADRVVSIGDVSALLERAGLPATEKSRAEKPASLRHEEHHWMTLPPGNYSVRQQCEWEGERSRAVED